MNSRRYNNRFFLFHLLVIALFGYCEHLAVDTSNRFAKCPPRANSLSCWLGFNLINILHKFLICIWHRVCKIDCVFIVLEFVRKAQRIKPLGIIIYVFLDSICIVRDPFTSLVPSNWVVFSVSLLLRVNAHFHSVIKKTVDFREIHNVKLYRCSFPRIPYLKIKPLGMSVSIDIILH